MKTALKPIALNGSPSDVALLHQVLKAFSLEVSEKEVNARKAGKDTLEKVRELQGRLNVPFDETALVDEATVAAVFEALEKRGLLDSTRSFTVSGTVRGRNGEAIPRLRLIAFDVDLRAVAVYRSIKAIAEISGNEGFEFLGEVVSDNRGSYEITFYDWQYGEAERKKADVVVYAVEEQEIIGRSRIVNSDDYSDKGQVTGLDIFISRKDTKTEYEVLMEPLLAFLKESKTSLAEIAASSDQMIFTAGELDLDLDHLRIAASAELLFGEKRQEFSHELLYGIGRQNINLTGPALYKKTEQRLREAIVKSVDEQIIRASSNEKVDKFLAELHESSVKNLLEGKEKETLIAILSQALPEPQYRMAFLSALRSFKDSDFSKFWHEYLPAQPEFKDQPSLISNLLFTQQLLLLSGDHLPLMKEVQTNRNLSSTDQLFDLKHDDWKQIILKTGVPDFIQGQSDDEKVERYAKLIQGSLNATFPTKRISKMLVNGELPIEKAKVARSIRSFLSQNKDFDISRSRIHEFDKQLEELAGNDFGEVKEQLKRVQRVFQVSPNPEAMSVLMESNLHSATAIANIPQASFLRSYSGPLGGEEIAFAIHERASHISERSEFTAMHLMEYTQGATPNYAMDVAGAAEALASIQNQVPNYAELFGSPDICECEQCNSVYSAAAYFVDLLRFLWRSTINSQNESPLDVLSQRRPDLIHLPLTCENTNTIIPYIDLANEVMEYYTAHGSLTSFEGYDTGETTAEELRANPQNFNLEAYRKLKDAKYPFTLPYHQPLDAIRTFSDHLRVSRYEAMKAMNPEPDSTTARAIAAESLTLCQEEYVILTGEAFDGTPDITPLHEYFGYSEVGNLEHLSAVREFLSRSGLAYTDLVELVKSSFINPFQDRLEFLQKLFSFGAIDSNTLYTKLEQIEAGTLDPANDPDIVAALIAYTSDSGESVTTSDFAQWITDHLNEFRQVITLFEPDSKCELDSTSLRTIESIYEAFSTSGIMNDIWSKIHRFIRLWRKLGWTIHETDLMLAALGQDDITSETINRLEFVAWLKTNTKLAPNLLAVFWGNIDTYGDKSLYKKLFLNKSAQQIDDAFKADAWGNYLQDQSEKLIDHQSAIIAAFRITEESLTAILEVAQVVEGGNPRLLDIETDVLNIQNLSTIYRYVLLAKALKLRVTDLCDLIRLFGAAPFSIWDITNQEFTSISSSDTYEFHKVAAASKAAGFKPSMLEYILLGTLPADSNIGLNPDEVLQACKDIRAAFAAIDQDQPETPETTLTSAVLTAKLSLTFPAEIVSRSIRILENTTTFESATDANLNIVIPDDETQDAIDDLVAAGTFATAGEAAAFLGALSVKYKYVKGSGRLICAGTMTDLERDTLKGLTNVNANFENALDELYQAPEVFISTHFNGIFNNLVEANATLLDHPAQPTSATLDEKLSYVYARFIPILKDKLRHDAITRYVSALIGLTEAATALLIARDVGSLIKSLSSQGFSGEYFSDGFWSTSVVQRTDNTIDFSWGVNAPDALLPADNFSVRWGAYVAAPASGEYTLVVETAGSDEAFNLYLDNLLILQKAPVDLNTSWEVITNLNASLMHRLSLEYSEAVQEAGIRLYWKTATTAREITPSSAAYPAIVVDSFASQVTLFHRAAKFILGFKLSETELDHFINFNIDFGSIDFKALEASDWQRLYSFTTLRNAVPQAQALLTDIFALANSPSPVPTVTDLRTNLHLATAWDETSLQYLIDDYFALTTTSFKNEMALNRLYEVMKVVSRSGLSAETIASWGEAETDFDPLNVTAQVLKNAVKAKYEDKDWLELAGKLTDKIRENQKNSLVSYLLTLTAIQNWGAKDADGLFEYFLIDVQMGACMDTSRIVQANSSIQMFVNRCLLNLESDISGSAERGVSPGSIDKDRWEWMKNYRVWEANRKVFLYPENWLEPEWRNDRSEFFKDLESFLVQNDITDKNAEQAFRNYLTSLNRVANLEVCGIHRENYDDGGAKNGTLKYLHVFARTHNAPYKFFYRTWNEYRKWSAWETVPVDIRCIEEGDDSGVHVLPVVWKKRLILFWPEFIEKQKPPSKGNKTIEKAAEDNISSMEPQKYWEIRLAWSEYGEGRWSPKQVSKEFSQQWPDDFDDVTSPKDLLFTVKVNSTQQLTITVSDGFWNTYRGDFTLSDIQSPVQSTDTYWGFNWAVQESNYSYKFSKRTTVGKLELMDDVYLQRITSHNLLPVDTFKGLDITLDSPFFFSDAHRTYFVRPVPIRVYDRIKDPGFYVPYLPGLVDDSGFNIPIEIPEVGPDDFVPVDFVDPIVDVGRATYALTAPGLTRPMLVAYIGPDTSTFATSTTRMGIGSPAAGLPMAAAGTSITTRTLGSTRAGSLVIGSSALETGPAMTFARTEYVGGAFTFDLGNWAVAAIQNYRPDTGLEFHTFYHPFSGRYVTNLNQEGLPGLMESDTEITSDEGTTFVNTYNPNFTQGFVQKPADFASGTYYKENVCFWVYGANSLYNMELFFHAPLYIATRLSKNGQYEQAMAWFHYIFDPTTDEMPSAGETEISRYWKVLPFKTTPAESLEDWFRNNLAPNTDPNNPENAIVGEWRDNPFDPHLVASNRPLAYMKHVVGKYVENLIAWGDSLFRQFTRESVNEALQIYVIANHILGSRPEFVPRRGKIKAESYFSLSAKWDDFSNALVELENIFPYSSEVSVGNPSTGGNLLGIGPAFYFCIPANEKLLELWDTIADRLYKIRHCQDLNGVERHLALFAPPIDPAALIQATSQGLSLGSILADLSSPPPIYRFTYLIQKANEFCGEVKGLGSALLAALEKKDAEELSRLRASQETQMLELVTAVKERQVLDSKARKEGLEKTRDTARFRLQHYSDLLGNDTVSVPASPTVTATLTADSQLPGDTTIATIATDVDQALVDSNESGVKLISREQAELDKSALAMTFQQVGTAMEGLAGTMNFIPNFSAQIEPFGCGATISYGGSNIAGGISGLAKVPQIAGSVMSHEAMLAAKMATYIRREQDWTVQANLAAKEIIQLDKQITSADIQIQVAEKELSNHQQQIENAEQVELFLQNKFTTQELYQWMKEQLFAVYKQSYNLAYDLARKAEKAYKYEIGSETASFIQYGYWDNSKQGLAAGEKLQLALRQLEKSYLEENRRELELTKSISFALLNPLALIELRETGKCYVSVPEELFDLDFPGHYFRRIKSASVSIPCVAGPYTAVNCSLRLLSNSIRTNTTMNTQGAYEHENDEGVWIDDDRFRSSNAPMTSIATSTAQNDSGVFEFNFRDERYLPFEGSGAISDWQLELSTEKDFRQFDYSTIADVILQLRFTARENGGLFKDGAVDYLKRFIANDEDWTNEPMMRGFSMKHEFSTEWHRFLHPAVAGEDQILSFTLGKESFPFFTRDRVIVVTELVVLARCSKVGVYKMILTLTNLDEETVVSSEVNMPISERYGGMNKATLAVNAAGLNLDELDISGPMTLKLKFTTALDYKSLNTDPDEVDDLFVVFHYKLG